MADALYELLLPYLALDTPAAKDGVPSTARSYLERLQTLSLGHLTSTENASLSHASQSTFRSLQALSKRSHGSITNSADHLNHLPDSLTSLRKQSGSIQESMTQVESSITEFAQKYERNTGNEILERRKTAMLLNSNAERLGNIMELPSLLESTVSSSAASSASAGGATVASGPALSGYASALDIHAHVRRLSSLYPKSELVAGISHQADTELSNMITVLINTLQSPGLKLAVAMRTIGWLRRVAPELSMAGTQKSMVSGKTDVNLTSMNEEGALGSLFLVCRLTTLRRTLEALEPLRQLAEQETARHHVSLKTGQDKPAEKWSGGTQSERYLKRFIEIFREQSFAIISMYKSIFPTSLPVPGSGTRDVQEHVNGSENTTGASDVALFGERASALADFVPELVEMLMGNLREFLPNLSDRPSRDSLLSQVLFCAGSLGRLGAEFSLMLALLEEDLGASDTSDALSSNAPEWVDVMKKHRVQASRLEVLASGVGTGRKVSVASIGSQPPSPSVVAR